MLGVVVWTADKDRSAIVWCEDQGDLAFIEMNTHCTSPSDCFGKGDLIQFDLEIQADLRLAHNPRRIAQHYCVGLEDVVAQAQALRSNSKPPAGCTVVDLATARQEMHRSVA